MQLVKFGDLHFYVWKLECTLQNWKQMVVVFKLLNVIFMLNHSLSIRGKY